MEFVGSEVEGAAIAAVRFDGHEPVIQSLDLN